jgi:hypothetical protein
MVVAYKIIMKQTISISCFYKAHSIDYLKIQYPVVQALLLVFMTYFRTKGAILED